MLHFLQNLAQKSYFLACLGITLLFASFVAVSPVQAQYDGGGEPDGPTSVTMPFNQVQAGEVTVLTEPLAGVQKIEVTAKNYIESGKIIVKQEDPNSSAYSDVISGKRLLALSFNYVNLDKADVGIKVTFRLSSSSLGQYGGLQFFKANSPFTEAALAQVKQPSDQYAFFTTDQLIADKMVIRATPISQGNIVNNLASSDGQVSSMSISIAGFVLLVLLWLMADAWKEQGKTANL